jgi:low affinity Fe/Cu permease
MKLKILNQSFKNKIIMKQFYFKVELRFEKLVSLATKILGNSITFILACTLVLSWWISSFIKSNDLHQNIGDFIFGITFLSLFIIQKSFNRYSALIHLKMNELISSHASANNSVMNMSSKTENEIREMAREYLDIQHDIELVINKPINNLKT